MADGSASQETQPRLWARVGDTRTAPSAGTDAWTVALRLGATGLVVTPRRSDDAQLVVGAPGRFMRRRTLSMPLVDLWADLATAEVVAIDLSEAGALDAAGVARILQQAFDSGFRGRLAVMSQDQPLLRDLAGSDEHLMAGTATLHLSDPRSTERGAEAHAAALRNAGIDGVVTPEDRTSAGLVALMHRFGRIVLAQGADYRRTVRRALGIGVDGVIGSDAEALHDAWVDSSEPGDP